jgi:predicted Zn finger-like uncharacterized protein
MYTVCPKCTLALAVTAADLRAGQGYVRCGRCANVFNALLALQDETDTSPGLPIIAVGLLAPGGAIEALAGPQADPSPAAEDARSDELAPTELASGGDPASIEEGSARFADDEESYTEISPEALGPLTEAPARRALRAAATRPEPPATVDEDQGSTEVDEFRGTGTYETIVLEGEGYLQTEELLPDEEIDAGIAAVSRQLAAAHGPTPVAELALTGDPALRYDQVPPNVENEADANADADAAAMAAAIAEAVARLGPPARARRRRPVLVAGAVLLIVLLAVQALHHWRNQLATQPALTGPLTNLYAAVGQPLTPDWDLAAYDVRQLGASADGLDNRAIHVRLSLASRARVPQGLPLVRLTLIDRYGKALSAGELKPEQYLPPAQRGLRLIAPDQRIDTDVSVLDASQQASSFELDVCLPRASGGLRCSADAALAGGRT